MAAESFSLKIVTPQGLYTDQEVAAVTLPSVDGDIGILPQHTKYTGLLGVGVLEYQPLGAAARRVVVSRGFCSFSGAKLKILADRVDDLESLRASPGAAAANSAARKEKEQRLAEISAYEREWGHLKDEVARLDALDALK